MTEAEFEKFLDRYSSLFGVAEHKYLWIQHSINSTRGTVLAYRLVADRLERLHASMV